MKITFDDGREFCVLPAARPFLQRAFEDAVTDIRETAILACKSPHDDQEQRLGVLELFDAHVQVSNISDALGTEILKARGLI